MELHLGQFFQGLEIQKSAVTLDADGIAESFALCAGKNRLALFAVAGSKSIFRCVKIVEQIKEVQAWHVPKDRPMESLPVGNDLNLNGVTIPSGDGILMFVELVK